MGVRGCRPALPQNLAWAFPEALPPGQNRSPRVRATWTLGRVVAEGGWRSPTRPAVPAAPGQLKLAPSFPGSPRVASAHQTGQPDSQPESKAGEGSSRTARCGGRHRWALSVCARPSVSPTTPVPPAGSEGPAARQEGHRGGGGTDTRVPGTEPTATGAGRGAKHRPSGWLCPAPLGLGTKRIPPWQPGAAGERGLAGQPRGPLRLCTSSQDAPPATTRAALDGSSGSNSKTI